MSKLDDVTARIRRDGMMREAQAFAILLFVMLLVGGLSFMAGAVYQETRPRLHADCPTEYSVSPEVLRVSPGQ